MATQGRKVSRHTDDVQAKVDALTARVEKNEADIKDLRDWITKIRRGVQKARGL